jgi:hypothetical protein
MKTDTYTKIILTVIAVCLVSIVLKPLNTDVFVSNANAQSYLPPTTPRVIDVNIVSIDGKPFGGLDVDTLHPALPIKIVKGAY